MSVKDNGAVGGMSLQNYHREKDHSDLYEDCNLVGKDKTVEMTYEIWDKRTMNSSPSKSKVVYEIGTDALISLIKQHGKVISK